MKRRTTPLVPVAPKTEGPLTGSDSDFIARLAVRLADGSRPGILTAVDSRGKTRARWMPTIGFGDFPRLYATLPHKTAGTIDLNLKPCVTWTFANDSRSVVISLTGRARVVTEAGLVNRVWKLRAQRSPRLFDNRPAGEYGFVLVETEVEAIDCNIQQGNFKSLADSLARAEASAPSSCQWAER